MFVEKFFNEDNIVWYTIGKAADIIILNIVFILCCLPIVTIGASVTALYTVTLKQVKDEAGYMLRSFFSALKSNFKQSTIIWLIMLIIGVLLVGEWYFMGAIQSSFAAIFNYIFMFIGLCYLMILSYVFPLQSKFENKITATFLNSALMGIAYFLPWTLLIVLINVLPVLMIMVDVNALVFIFPIMTICGFSLLACINSLIFQKIFCKIVEKG